MKAYIRALLDGTISVRGANYHQQLRARAAARVVSKGDRVVALQYSNSKCYSCGGTGARARSICLCVRRAAFSACLEQYFLGANEVGQQPSIKRCGCAHKENHSFSFSSQDFAHDFYLVTKRALDEGEWLLFQLHFLQELPWRVCCPKLSLDRGRFFHAVYRLMAKLGTVYMELKPYPLFPLTSYFDCQIHQMRSGVNWMLVSAAVVLDLGVDLDQAA